MVTKAEREAAEMELGLARPGQPALQWDAVGEDYDHVANLKNGESPSRVVSTQNALASVPLRAEHFSTNRIRPSVEVRI